MSFFGELLSTIGGDRAPAPPVKAPTKPIQTNVPLANGPKSGPSTPTIGSQAKPVYKGTAGTTSSQQGSSLKRKADEDSSDRPVKTLKPSPNSSSDLNGQKSAKPNGLDAKTLTTSSKPSSTPTSAVKPPPKAPSKGSYAEIMARAKEAQQSKVPSQVGTIKHQATEKIKVSKLAERKKEEQEKAKTPAQAQPLKPGPKGKIDPRRRSTSPVKKGESSTPKQAKAPRPPLHGPPPPAYKGTMNTAPKKPRPELQKKKSSRYDEYLGTDEEEDDDDEGGYGYGGSDEYYSGDESDDMEGGFDDLEAEERLAEKAAREDDARELALENRLKREKMERKQKLAALAQKKR